MPKQPEVEPKDFFKGWPKPAKGYQCTCRPDGQYGPSDLRVVMADGREFTARMIGVMRSPYSPDVLQVDYDAIRQWSDGTPMTAVERRQVAMIICWDHESQLYAGEADQQEVPCVT